MIGAMGIKDYVTSYAGYGVHRIHSGKYVYSPKGKLATVTKPLAGAVAEYEAGDYAGERTTLTRVAAGAIIAGPVGAIVGGMFRKDRTRGYVTVTFADGDVAIVDGPIKDADKMRAFAEKINAAATK